MKTAKKRVAILLSGGGSNMETLAQDMIGDPDHPATPCLVLSNIPGAGGLNKARALNIPVALVDHRAYGHDRAGFEAALTVALEKASPDIICFAGFMRILTPDFISRWAGRMLNIHPSLLPKYKGLNTHARALAAGDTQAGCSVHQVTAELDGGPVLGQARIAVTAKDTAETLAAKVLKQEHRLYPAVLRRFAAGEPGRLEL